MNLRTWLNDETHGWWRSGLSWGMWMYLLMSVALPWIDEGRLSQRRLLIGIPLWMIAGLLYGGVTTRWNRASGKENTQDDASKGHTPS
jgi:hypothetical protein